MNSEFIDLMKGKILTRIKTKNVKYLGSDTNRNAQGQCCQKTKNKKKKHGPGASGSTCNPSCSGGRDQEDNGSKPTPGK
jgi:hypothetical protein